MTYTKYDHGPLQSYEVTWATGHVETIQAHQVIAPPLPGILGEVRDPRWMFHGEIDGRWMLLLATPAASIHSVRNVTQVPDSIGGES